MPKFSKQLSEFFKGAKDKVTKFLTSAQDEFNNKVRGGLFNLEEEMNGSEFAKSAGERKAMKWFMKYTKDNKSTGLMEAGYLYSFQYPDPKYKDTLAFYDTNPLILCMGHYVSQQGDIIEIGLNLHFLPLDVRKQVLIYVFDMYKSVYRGQLYRKRTKMVDVNWRVIGAPLEQKFGASFAYRSYIPKRRKGLVRFAYEDWGDAVYVPSLGYVRTSIKKLKSDYIAYVKGNKRRTLGDILKTR